MMIRKIRELDAELETFVLGSKDYLKLVNEAYSDNIHWSVKIEGNKLTLDEVRRIIDMGTGGKVLESPSGPQQEILNHLYSFHMKSAFDMPWNLDTVLHTHKMLMDGVSEHSTPGKLRAEEVSVVDVTGAEYFIACPAGHLTDELNSLMDWLNNSPYDELVSAVLFFHEFESIHPFRDGNGRTGRTLFQILLQAFGLKNAKLCKFEKELLSNTEVYYSLLAYTDQTENYGPLVMYFAEALLKAYSEAVVVFSEKDILKDLDLNERRLALMAKDARNFTLAEASTWVPMISQQSVRNKLNVLIGLNLLESTGMTRNLKYRFLDPLAELKAVHTLAEREGVLVETVDEAPIDSQD